jgi:hypothetical protein
MFGLLRLFVVAYHSGIVCIDVKEKTWKLLMFGGKTLIVKKRYKPLFVFFRRSMIQFRWAAFEKIVWHGRLCHVCVCILKFCIKYIRENGWTYLIGSWFVDFSPKMMSCFLPLFSLIDLYKHNYYKMYGTLKGTWVFWYLFDLSVSSSLKSMLLFAPDLI